MMVFKQSQSLEKMREGLKCYGYVVFYAIL